MMRTVGNVAFIAICLAARAQAALLTFDVDITSQTSFAFDGDGDAKNDIVISTSAAEGFNTVGPGLNQSFINEPGLEGTSIGTEDLRLSFLNGAVQTLTLGFALNSDVESPAYFGSLELFDTNNNLLGTIRVPGVFTVLPGGGISSFPEGRLNVQFTGVAAYGVLNFESQFGRFIIDNLEGTFGSTELPSPIPEPGSGWFFFAAVMCIVTIYRQRWNVNR